MLHWKVNSRPPTSTPRGAKTSGGSRWKLVRLITSGGLTKGAKFQICNHPGSSGRWVKIYILLFGDFFILFLFLPTFFYTRSGRTARQTAAPSVLTHEFPCKEVPFGGPVEILPFLVILGAKTPNFGGLEIGNSIITKIANNSKTLLDREKVTIDQL